MSALRFEVDFRDLMAAMRKVAPEVEKETRRELRDIGAVVVREARSRVPSGFAKSRTGWRWRYWSGSGVVLEALGGDKASPPKAYASAAEGGPSGNRRIRHPLFGNRKHWYSEEPFHPLHDVWDERKEWARARTVEAVNRGMRRAGFGG